RERLMALVAGWRPGRPRLPWLLTDATPKVDGHVQKYQLARVANFAQPPRPFLPTLMLRKALGAVAPATGRRRDRIVVLGIPLYSGFTEPSTRRSERGQVVAR